MRPRDGTQGSDDETTDELSDLRDVRVRAVPELCVPSSLGLFRQGVGGKTPSSRASSAVRFRGRRTGVFIFDNGHRVITMRKFVESNAVTLNANLSAAGTGYFRAKDVSLELLGDATVVIIESISNIDRSYERCVGK